MTSVNVCNVCQKPAFQKCGGCQNVFYCSKEHQKDDWKGHKKNCLLYKISSNESLGRYLTATRDLKNNEVIMKEKPLIYGPAQGTIPVCLGCNEAIIQNNHTFCSRCNWPMCSEKCQNNPCHVPECHYIQKSAQKICIDTFGSPNPFYQCITVLRCLYQKKHNPSLWKKLMLLEDHCEERKSTAGYYNEKVMATELIHKLFNLENQFTLDEIMKVCGIIMVNAHEVPLSEPPHIAIFEKTSMLEHDCSSNCSKSFTDSGEILITSGIPIKKGDHLSICYADPLWMTTNRRHFLYETKFFWCTCKRCSDPTEFGTYFSAVCCQRGDCDGYLLPKTFLQPQHEVHDWYCNKCSYSVSNTLVEKLLEKVAEDISHLDKSNIGKCKCFLKKLKGILPPNSWQLVDIKLTMVQSIGQINESDLYETAEHELKLKQLLCGELVSLMDKLIPSEKRVRGLLLFELHACLAEIARTTKETNSNSKKRRHILEESKTHLMECMELLKYEPEILPEGNIYVQARKNLGNLIHLLNELQ